MKFCTYGDRFDRKDSDAFDSCSGEPIGLTYEYRTKNGIKSLVPSGKVDRQAIIESYADECDIVKTINRFLDGDVSVMNPNSGSYGDFTNLPTSYAEMFDRLQMCKNIFDAMPSEIKLEFDNSVESFWTQFGSERFDKVFNEYNKIESEKTDPIIEKPIVEGEVKVDA